MEKVKLKDFLSFTTLSDISLSPDAKHAAYFTHNCNSKNDCYDSKIHITDLLKSDIILDTDGNASLFCWEDNSNIIYGVKQDLSTVFWRINIQTQETSKAFCIPCIAKSIDIVKDGSYLISTRMAIKDEPTTSDCIIIDELPIRYNGAGYTSGTRIALYIFDELSNSFEEIMPKGLEVMQFSLCYHQNKIVVSGLMYSDYKIVRGEIYLYDIETKNLKEIVSKGKFRVSYVSMYNDNIIFAGTLGKRNSIMENQYFYTVDINTLEIKEFSTPDYYLMGLSVGSDCRFGSGKHCVINKDKIYFNATHSGNGDLFEIDSSGEYHSIVTKNGTVDFFDVRDDTAVFIGMRGTDLQELYLLDLKTGREKQLTNFNTEYTKSHSVIKPIPSFFKNSDGIEVSGWVLPPLNYDKCKKYPAILDIHGGPKSSYGTVYFHEMQVWANEGYFVLFCNPRGSDGHGDEYSTLMGKNGTIDYSDIMEFTDMVLKKFPAIDENRVGVTGGSYGGFMTNWIVGHTDRFAAAAAQRGIGDWIVHEYAADTGYWVTSEMFLPNAIENYKEAWEHSPVKYANKIRTPLLFIHSDEDFRCPLEDALSVYTGAMSNGADVRMCLFHGENHELSRSGKPNNRTKRLEEITRWMNIYLKGDK